MFFANKHCPFVGFGWELRSMAITTIIITPIAVAIGIHRFISYLRKLAGFLARYLRLVNSSQLCITIAMAVKSWFDWIGVLV